MHTPFSKIVRRALPVWRDQSGITGLETAIVLIAFVVVASVFAFAILSTGMFSTDKAKETIRAGLGQARSTMQLRGAVLARIQGSTPGTAAVVDQIFFQVALSAGGLPIDLAPGKTIIKYSDKDQVVTMATTSTFSVTNVSATDTDTVLEPGEIYEIKLLDVDGQTTPDLGIDKTFKLEIFPAAGPPWQIERNTPAYLEVLNDLN